MVNNQLKRRQFVNNYISKNMKGRKMSRKQQKNVFKDAWNKAKKEVK